MDACKLKFPVIDNKQDMRPVMLFFEDEGRFGRINNLSACWSPIGQRPMLEKQLIRKYTYAYTAVCPETGENFSLILPYADKQCFNIFLKLLSDKYLQYRIILTLDGASNHHENNFDNYDNIVPLHLPPYSPELNPVEHIWDYIREQHGFNNHTFKTMLEVENKLELSLHTLQKQKKIVHSMTNFPWINYNS